MNKIQKKSKEVKRLPIEIKRNRLATSKTKRQRWSYNLIRQFQDPMCKLSSNKHNPEKGHVAMTLPKSRDGDDPGTVALFLFGGASHNAG